MKTLNSALGDRIVSLVAAMDEAALKALITFRGNGTAEKLGTIDEMSDVIVDVDPNVCLVEGGTFECAANAYWNWGQYCTESFGRIVGTVNGDEDVITSIEINHSDN